MPSNAAYVPPLVEDLADCLKDLELFIKAIVNTQQSYKKINGGFVGETTNLPYYVSEEDKIRLKNTEIVENFYNQKNLWEIFLEIGKYIHSIPKVTFGENEKFLV